MYIGCKLSIVLYYAGVIAIIYVTCTSVHTIQAYTKVGCCPPYNHCLQFGYFLHVT